MLRDGDSVVFMAQSSGEGEIIVATDEGKFKRVISSQIEPSKRYRKGNIIVSMKEGASVIAASYVTVPYAIAIVEKTGGVSQVSSEDIFITMQSARAKKLVGYAEGSIEKVIPLPYQKEE
jgi:DNA gyrase/topoisomerase IV subunit A